MKIGGRVMQRSGFPPNLQGNTAKGGALGTAFGSVLIARHSPAGRVC